MSTTPRSSFRCTLGLAFALNVAPAAALAADAASTPLPYKFVDVAAAVSLVDPLRRANAHAAAWGDIDGDGHLDLFVGTFADKTGGDGVPNQVLWHRNTDGKRSFAPDADPAIQSTGRGTGSILADFDNDGLLDLFVTNHTRPTAAADTAPGRPDRFYRALPNRTWHDVSESSGAVRTGITSRNAAPLDFDGDGLLDLLVVHAVGKSDRKSVV